MLPSWARAGSACTSLLLKFRFGFFDGSALIAPRSVSRFASSFLALGGFLSNVFLDTGLLFFEQLSPQQPQVSRFDSCYTNSFSNADFFSEAKVFRNLTSIPWIV